jgi:hypothetical protein
MAFSQDFIAPDLNRALDVQRHKARDAGTVRRVGKCNAHGWLKSGAIRSCQKSHQRRAEICALPFNSKYLQKCH